VKHHYIPAMYLRQWSGLDGQLCEHKRIASKIAVHRTWPEGTGYKPDLYRINGVPDELAQEVETQYMKMLDTRAADALKKLVRGEGNSLKSTERAAWARFLVSLIFRNPEAVQTINTHMTEMWAAANESFLNPSFVGAGASEYAMKLLQEVIDSVRPITDIKTMGWRTISVAGAAVPLLTSDRPWVLSRPLDAPDAYVLIPISPSVLFLAEHTNMWSRRIRSVSPSRIVEIVNQDTIRSARTYVWGIDDRQLPLVETWIGTNPDREIITKEQREQALNIARGAVPDIWSQVDATASAAVP